MLKRTIPLGQRAHALSSIPILSDPTLTSFRAHAFEPSLPHLLPRGTFAALPAVSKWFTPTTPPDLAPTYLSRFSTAHVSLELTSPDSFTQIVQPLSFFLDFHSTPRANGVNLYLAQASLSDLPEEMRQDVPTPEIVKLAGKGDVYDTSIWIGKAPTYTPLHRDPNPNLFVQLAGTKRVRIFRPEVGGRIFAKVKAKVGGAGSATMRGEEMMVGEERRVLEEVVWSDGGEIVPDGEGMEAEVHAGDGLFIPKGWWHSIKGVGEGITGSVNWWFR